MMPRCIAIIQARMTSTRLPGKVMLPLGPGTVLHRVISRAARIPGLSAVCVAIPEGAEHDGLAGHAQAIRGCLVVRGPEHDVLKRYRLAAEASAADYVMRITSDCPLIDPGVCGMVLDLALRSGGYARTAFDRGYPLGLDVEAMPAGLLAEADAEAAADDEREHVTPFIWRRPDRYPLSMLDRLPDRRAWRLTLDEPADYELMRAIEAGLGDEAGMKEFADVEALLLRAPGLLALNSGIYNKTPIGMPGQS